MGERPSCIVHAPEVGAFDRPLPEPDDGVGFRVRPLSDAAGLTRMGVKLREIPAGRAGTHRHFHDVEEEWTYVLAGTGHLTLGPLSLAVRPGHFASFRPGPSPHCFVAGEDEPLLVFEGGERRRSEDWCTYPELGVRARDGVDDPIDVEALPPFEGDASQLVHTADVAERARPHPLDADAVRHQRDLDAAAGAERQACTHVRLEPGVSSTVFHTHDRTDEWVYLLSGEAEVRVGDAWHAVGAGDFVGYPANGPAHAMRAVSEVTYLMGGQHDPTDVVMYPERGLRLKGGAFEAIR